MKEQDKMPDGRIEGDDRLRLLLDLLPPPAPMDAALQGRLLALPALRPNERAAWTLTGLRNLLARPLALGEAGLLAASLIAGLWWGALGLGVERTPDLSSLVLGHDAGFPEETGQ